MKPFLRTLQRTGFALWLALVATILSFTPPALAKESLSVNIQKVARLTEDGEAVILRLKLRCEIEGYEVLEAFVYVSQEGTSNFHGIPVNCGAQSNPQIITVHVTPLDFEFHPGAATATAFILLIDPLTQDTLSFGDFEEIRIK